MPEISTTRSDIWLLLSSPMSTAPSSRNTPLCPSRIPLTRTTGKVWLSCGNLSSIFQATSLSPSVSARIPKLSETISWSPILLESGLVSTRKPAMLSCWRLTRLVPSPSPSRPLKCRWTLAGVLWSHTDPEKPKTPLSPIWSSVSRLARSRPALLADPSDSPSTTSFFESKRTSAPTPFSPDPTGANQHKLIYFKRHLIRKKCLTQTCHMSHSLPTSSTQYSVLTSLRLSLRWNDYFYLCFVWFLNYSFPNSHQFDPSVFAKKNLYE